MEVHISEGQVRSIAEKQVMNRIKPEINAALKNVFPDKYSIRSLIEDMTYKIVEERINSIVSDKQLRAMVKEINLTELVSQKIIKAVSDDVVEVVERMFD
jgi:hypothetical protein